MPWCASCDRFLSPSTVLTEGTCPQCGRVVDPGRAHAPTASKVSAGDAPAGEDDLPAIPWHLKLLAAALAVYLGFRAWQGIEWLIGRL